jgi:hypothetical protein
MAKMNPLERLGTPQDIAAAVSFLAGPDGGWINGPGASREWRNDLNQGPSAASLSQKRANHHSKGEEL